MMRGAVTLGKLAAITAWLFGNVTAEALTAHETAISACPGYIASNLQTRQDGIIGADLRLAGKACNVYGTDVNDLRLQVEYQTEHRLHVKIYDVGEQVYQVPSSVLPRPGNGNVSPDKSDLKISVRNNPFSFTISRRSTGEVLFDTTGQHIVFESQYLRLRTSLPNDPNIYGIGETTDSFRKPTTNYTHTLWSRDAYGTPQQSNLYGNHPVYYDYRGSKGTHGVFLLNSNGMDITIDKDAGGQFLEYNTIGGVIDLYFLSGPTPKDVAIQYAQTVGNAVMMPYWSLGFHNCRYGYQDIYEVAEVIANYSLANIPLETQWNDIDYMDLRKVFTLDPLRYPLKLFQEVVSYLHSHNQYHVMMVDPAVAYQNYPAFNNGAKDDAFLKFSNGSIYQGVVWPGITAFPDWFAPNTQEYWDNEFSTFFDPSTGVDIDGLWIDMNEASNFCPYPCSDPAAFAVTNNDPPAPPPVRLSAPRPIPGFGPDFQPKCVATVNFDVYAETYFGENILILGDAITLGGGSVQSAAAMNANNYPHWQATVQMPPNSTYTYEYVRKESDGSYIYEAKNHTIKTGDCNSGIQNVFDNITTSSGAHKRSADVGAMILDRAAMPIDELAKREGPMLGLPGRNLIDPPYHINNTAGSLSNLAINTDLIHANGLAEYDTHNMYGTMMSASSRGALLHRRPNARPLVITRSTFAGAGRQVGHWLGDNFADWDHYRWTIAEIQEFAALFQIPMVGSDICGYAGVTNDDLCSRWVFIGAFSPFFRDHSDIASPPHELYRTPQIAAAARAAIDIRYRLLDYAYTAMWTQTTTGAPMINPLFFVYPSDIHTANTPYQYFWGDSIMVAPVTDENSTSVDVYFPEDLFYDFFTGALVSGKGNTVTLSNVAFDTIPLYYKGGSIVPQRVSSANTTAQLRQQNFVVVIAPDSNGAASGQLYLDDGDSINQPKSSEITFTYKRGQFSMSGKFGYDAGDVHVTQIRLLGAPSGGRGGSFNAPNKVATYTVNVKLTGNFQMSL